MLLTEKHMVSETGTVVAVESDALWVETIQQSTCGTCSARKGCGQRLLAKVGASSSRLRVPLSCRSHHKGHINTRRYYAVGDTVTIGIPDNTVVLGSLFIYLLPLVLMIAFSGIGHTLMANEIVSLVAGIVGFVSGGAVIRYHSNKFKNDSKFQPVLILDVETLRTS